MTEETIFDVAVIGGGLSRRLTSCWMISSNRSRAASVRAIGRVSTALRSEVNGFLSARLFTAGAGLPYGEIS